MLKSGAVAEGHYVHAAQGRNVAVMLSQKVMPDDIKTSDSFTLIAYTSYLMIAQGQHGRGIACL